MWETLNPEPEPQQVIILQGIEVVQAKRRANQGYLHQDRNI